MSPETEPQPGPNERDNENRLRIVRLPTGTRRDGSAEEPSEPETPLPEDIVSLGLTHVRIIERFVQQHGSSVLFCAALGGWLFYDGRHWIRSDREVYGRLVALVRAVHMECLNIEDTDLFKEAMKFLLRAESKEGIAAMMALAEKALAVGVEMFDKQQWLVNVLNGTLDLQTGKLRPHDSADFITKLLKTSYDPVANCPVWKNFISTMLGNDNELIVFAQRLVGYSLSGQANERIIILLVGSGKNGKSTLLDLLRILFGDADAAGFAHKVDAGALTKTKQRDTLFQLAVLRGARIVSLAEKFGTTAIDIELLKELAGNEAIVARHPHGRPFTFKPEFTLWVGTNKLPAVPDDLAIFDRLRIVPCNVRFYDTEQEAVAGCGDKSRVKDVFLPDKLIEELPGILAWAVQGCLDWKKHGLAAPKAVQQATAAYQRQSNPLPDFLIENCVIEPNAKIIRDDLWEAFQHWAEESGRALSKFEFLAGVKAQVGSPAPKRIEGMLKRCWVGIRLRKPGEKIKVQQGAASLVRRRC